jgi:cytochrome c-type biogenesis protein CcmH/NrfF
METLRCLQCQGQSIADSDAPIAGDMRHQVRTRIKAGEDPEAIRGWLVNAMAIMSATRRA